MAQWHLPGWLQGPAARVNCFIFLSIFCNCLQLLPDNVRHKLPQRLPRTILQLGATLAIVQRAPFPNCAVWRRTFPNDCKVVPAFHGGVSGLGLPDHGLFPQPMGIVVVNMGLLPAADFLALMDHVVASLGFPRVVGCRLDLGLQDLCSPGGQLRWEGEQWVGTVAVPLCDWS